MFWVLQGQMLQIAKKKKRSSGGKNAPFLSNRFVFKTNPSWTGVIETRRPVQDKPGFLIIKPNSAAGSLSAAMLWEEKVGAGLRKWLKHHVCAETYRQSLPRESVALPLNGTYSLWHTFFSVTVPPSRTGGPSKDSTEAISSDIRRAGKGGSYFDKPHR